MADHQRIYPVDVEAPSAPVAPPDHLKGDTDTTVEEKALLQRPVPDAEPQPAAAAPLPRAIPPRKRRRSRCCRCLCWTLLAAVVLVVLVAATVGILYLVFRPKIPKYSVDRFGISEFSVDGNNTAHVGFDVNVTARNPNKRIGIYYLGGSEVSAWYNGTSLASGSVPAFYQGHRNTTVITVALAGEAQLGGELVEQLQRQQQTGTIPLAVRGRVPVKVKLGSLKLWKMTFRVRCNLVVNSLTASNQITLRSSSCKFKL